MNCQQDKDDNYDVNYVEIIHLCLMTFLEMHSKRNTRTYYMGFTITFYITHNDDIICLK